jgi:hypothetical protein
MILSKKSATFWAHALTQAALARPVGAPHLFEIVELPHLGPEDVDDNIGRIDQNPIAGLQSLDARGAQTALERDDEPLCDRSDVNVGAPGCDDHGVGERGFAVQVYGDNVLGFGIIETSQDSLHELTGSGT